MAKLPELCEIQYGYAFDSACFTEDNTYLPLVRIRDVKRGYSETFYSGNYPSDYVIDSGSLLVGMNGEFNIARWKGGHALLNQRVCKITAKENVNEEFIRFALSKALKEIENRTAFVTVKHLSAKELNQLEIDIPNYTTQTDVAKVLTQIESIISARQQQLQKLDELVKARFIELFGDPMNGTSKWKVSTIGEQFNVTSGGTPATGEKAYWDNGTIPWIGSNMCQDTILIKNDGKFITEEGYIHSSAKWFYKGTVLVALVGATIGKTALLRFDTTTNQNIAAIDVNGNAAFSSEFVFYHMQMLYAKFMEIGNGKFKMANQGFIRQLPLVCPPLALQQRFAAFVEQVDKSKVAVQKTLYENKGII